MEILDIILIAIALSMDACALTISNCSTYKCELDRKKEWAMPIAFAIFQGIMPLIGFYIGSLFSSAIGKVADYLSASIFFFLSAKIIIDILKERREKICPINSSSEQEKQGSFTFLVLIFQAIATSIDALAIGITFIDLTISIFIAVLIISVITFMLVSVALIFGKSLGKLFGAYAEWVGAGILFILAVKSLIQAIIG